MGVQFSDQQLLKPAKAAEFLDVAPKTLANMRTRGDGPPFIRVSARAIRYTVGDLTRWVADRRRLSTSDRGVR